MFCPTSENAYPPLGETLLAENRVRFTLRRD